MRGRWLIGGGVVAGALMAATAAGYDSILGRGAPKLNGDVPPALAETEYCAALFLTDGRQAAERLAQGDDPGAAFASRNDQFRYDWALRQLAEADAARDWRVRVEGIAARTPRSSEDSGYLAIGKAYGVCLEKQNADPAFTEGLHAALGYRDLP